MFELLSSTEHVQSCRVMQVNDVNLRLVRQMRFSPSGHLVAVAAGRDIVLLNTTWKIIATLKVFFCCPNHTNIVVRDYTSAVVDMCLIAVVNFS